MSPAASLLRIAARPAVLRSAVAVPRFAKVGAIRAYSGGQEESFEEFNARYEGPIAT